MAINARSDLTVLGILELHARTPNAKNKKTSRKIKQKAPKKVKKRWRRKLTDIVVVTPIIAFCSGRPSLLISW